MYKALTGEQARTLELRAVSEAGLTLDGLMESAGASVADAVGRASDAGPVLVLCGPGNNGGDGWVAARVLRAGGREVSVLSVKDPKKLSAEAATAAKAAMDAGIPWSVASKDSSDAFESASVIVDALLGIGARLPLTEPILDLCRRSNASSAVRVAVDVPTGVDSDNGAASEDAFRADVCVTFSSPKVGHVTYPGAMYCGDVELADIGIPPDYAETLRAPEIWTEDDYAAAVPIPRADAHKNSRGRVLVVAGSGRFPGAAILAAMGAMRSGAGYVTLAVPRSIVHVAQAHLLAAPVIGLPSSRGHTFAASAGDAALEFAADYDAVVLGPGLTLSDGAVVTARRIFTHLHKPLVMDADALNALVDAEDLLETRHDATVLTPHPGELSRLLRQSIGEIQADRLTASGWLAQGRRAIVLKGAGTVVSGSGRQAIITAGSPALATAGTGDVLAGVIGTLLAQGLDPYVAGALGAYLHGRAGELAAADRTPVGVIADDVPEQLPSVFAELLGSW